MWTEEEMELRARLSGIPYRGQIWSDKCTCLDEESYGDVEVTCANYSTVCFKHPKDGHTVPMRMKDFLRWFAFVRSPAKKEEPNEDASRQV